MEKNYTIESHCLHYFNQYLNLDRTRVRNGLIKRIEPKCSLLPNCTFIVTGLANAASHKKVSFGSSLLFGL